MELGDLLKNGGVAGVFVVFAFGVFKIFLKYVESRDKNFQDALKGLVDEFSKRIEANNGYLRESTATIGELAAEVRALRATISDRGRPRGGERSGSLTRAEDGE